LLDAGCWILVAGWSEAEIPIHRECWMLVGAKRKSRFIGNAGCWLERADFAKVAQATTAESGNPDSSGMLDTGCWLLVGASRLRQSSPSYDG